MELRDYLKIISKRIWILVVVTLVVTLGSYLFTASKPITFEGSTSINVVIKQSTTSKPDFYQYDNYYSIQASSLFADTVVDWLQDPSNVESIYSQANVNKSILNLKDYSELITAKKKLPATVTLTIDAEDSATVGSLIDSTTKFVQDKTTSWNREGLVKDIYLDNSKALVVEVKPPVTTNTALGLIIGLALGLAILFFVDYLKDDKS